MIIEDIAKIQIKAHKSKYGKGALAEMACGATYAVVMATKWQAPLVGYLKSSLFFGAIGAAGGFLVSSIAFQGDFVFQIVGEQGPDIEYYLTKSGFVFIFLLNFL